MNILLTGGCGFIGSNLIRHLYTTYPDMVLWNLDALTYAGNLNNLADLHQKESLLPPEQKRYHFVHGNLCDAAVLENLFAAHRFDAVVNLAAESHVDRSIMGAGDFINTNIKGVQALLDAARKYRVPRFVQISTDEVYGDQAGVDVPTAEAAPLRPSNPYSASKASADLIVQATMRTFNFPALIVRPSNNFGAYQYPEKWIPLTITNLLQGEKIPVHGDGQQVRSWLFVNDCCRAIDLVLHRGREHSIYNIAGTPLKNLEILHAIAEQLGQDPQTAWVSIPDRPGQDKKYNPDATKLRTELGWSPVHDFAEDLAATVAWYQQHAAWWQEVRNRDEFQAHYQKQSTGKWF